MPGSFDPRREGTAETLHRAGPEEPRQDPRTRCREAALQRLKTRQRSSTKPPASTTSRIRTSWCTRWTRGNSQAQEGRRTYLNFHWAVALKTKPQRNPRKLRRQPETARMGTSRKVIDRDWKFDSRHRQCEVRGDEDQTSQGHTIRNARGARYVDDRTTDK